MNLKRKFGKWKKKFTFSGKVPLNIYNAGLSNLKTDDELVELKLQIESKKRNIELTQKIYWGIIGTLTVGIISSFLFSLRTVAKNYPSKLYVLIGSAIAFFISYVILIIVIQVVIQNAHNTVCTHLELVKRRMKEK